MVYVAPRQKRPEVYKSQQLTIRQGSIQNATNLVSDKEPQVFPEIIVISCEFIVRSQRPPLAENEHAQCFVTLQTG